MANSTFNQPQTNATATVTSDTSLVGIKTKQSEIASKATATQTGLVTEPVPIPTFSWSGYIQGIGFLFLLIALLWIGVRFLRRFGRFSFMPRPGDFPRDALRMEAQMPIGPRKGLMVVRFLHKRLLLGVTDHEIRVLSSVTIEEEAAHEEAQFEKLMADASKQDAP